MRLYGDRQMFVCDVGHVCIVIVCVCVNVCMFVNVRVLVWWLCFVCMCILPCLYGDCGCLRGRMHICECV